MIRFTDNEIEQLILDDAPLGDLTSTLLGLHSQQGNLTIFAREALMAGGTEEAARVFEKLGLFVDQCIPSGTLCKSGDQILDASGNVGAIHMGWRAGGTMIEFASGIATRTHRLVVAAQSAKEGITVAGSRKHSPFLKKVALKALVAGGGVPHRIGLSDTILIFREHLRFLGGYENLRSLVQKIQHCHQERMVVVEAHTELEAMAVAQSGAHFLQIDKMSPSNFTRCANQCSKVNPRVRFIAAGGVNDSNAAEYANAGADVLVTSWMYAAPPSEIKVEIMPQDDLEMMR